MASTNQSSHKLNSVEFMTDFINLYRSLPALWKVKSADYCNKSKKEDAYQKMVELSKTVYEDANVEFVKSKINTIRGCFRKELKKVLASKRSGASADDVYVPKLWYYELLSFTFDQELPRQSTSSVPDEDCESIESGQVAVNSGSKGFEDEPTNTQDSPRLTPPQNPPPKGKRRATKNSSSKNATKEFFLATAEKYFDRDEFDSYFESVAAKMRRMNEEQRLFVEKIINEAVFLGMLKRLTEFSHVNTPSYNQQFHHSGQDDYSRSFLPYPSNVPSVRSPSPSSGSGGGAA